MFQIFANVEFYFKKNKFIAYASMLGAVLNIVLNYFGIMWFGYIAAGYTTLICYILFGISHYLFMKKVCHENLDDVQLFDVKTIFAAAFLLVLFAILMTTLYSHIIIRYCILLAVIIILIINRSKVMQYIKMLRSK